MVLAKDYETESYLSSGISGFHYNGFRNEAPKPVILRTDKPVIKTGTAFGNNRRKQPKILLYSHDTFGLGNIRRTLLLAENFKKQYPGSSILIITGSPVIHAFRLPEGIDYIKLPSLDRVDAEKYQPMFLADCAEEIRQTREAIIEKIALGFNPDLFIVDKRAAGINGELLPALKKVRRKKPEVRIILGLRDILDAPERTGRVLRENGSYSVIEKFYDEVWIYGLREVFDTAAEYGFPGKIREKTFYCGYLKRPVRKRKPGGKDFRILVTTGGGGDGSRMIGTYLEGLSVGGIKFPIFSKIVFGPQMPEKTRADLLARFGGLPETIFSDFEADLTEDYAEADLVISMAGYNTVCELLSHRKRAILIPRSEPVREQLIRARLLSKLGIFEMVEPTKLSPGTLIEKISGIIRTAKRQRLFPEMDGLPRINRRVENLLEEMICAS
ncbi:MAG: glycosyltransferase [Pyrinomonadaceae bacterium]